MKKNSIFILFLVVLLIIIVLLFTSSDRDIKNGEGDIVSNNGAVTFSLPSNCNGKTCYDFSVSCEGLPERKGKLHVSQNTNPQNTIFFMSGGPGTGLYSNALNKKGNVDFVKSKNARAVEIQWTSPNGWIAEGEGFVNSLCGFNEVVRAFVEQFPTEGNVCAQGNSGGSVQIQYGMSYYKMDEVFDAVIMTGGPAANYVSACGAGENPSTLAFPEESGVPKLIDLTLGFKNEAYCEKSISEGNAIPASAKIILNRESPLDENFNKKAGVDYNFPTTNVFFVESVADPLNLHNQAKMYFNQISGKKTEFIEIAQHTHGIDGSSEGSEIVRNLLEENCLI